MKKAYIILFALSLLCCPVLRAQDDDEKPKPDKDAKLIELIASDPRISIDTTFVRTYRKINDYSMIGIQYGVNLSMPILTPKRETKMDILPVEIGLMFTRYCKMFGYMSYFGFQGGLFLSQQSYQFDLRPETQTPVYVILGGYRARMNTVEVPLNAHFHVDMWRVKILANIGFFGGYRLNIHRDYHPNYQSDKYLEYKDSFHPNEKRLYYGFQGGAGLGLILDPIEIHIMAAYKYNLSNMHKPNVDLMSMEEGANKSNYYYSFTNLNSVSISVGIHYQLGRRTGKSREDLKQQAKEEALQILNDNTIYEKHNSADR